VKRRKRETESKKRFLLSKARRRIAKPVVEEYKKIQKEI